MKQGRKLAMAMSRTLLALIVALITANATAQSNQELVIGQSIDVNTFDPQNTGNTQVSAVLVNIFDYLVWVQADGSFEPVLATSWEQVTPTAWRFELRENVLWHDGRP